MRRSPILCVAALFGAALMTPAHAAFHLMKVVEVFPGTVDEPQAQFVELQMYSSGQTFVGGHAVRIYNAAGTQTASFSFAGSVGNGANQSSILVATPQAQSLFDVVADLAMTAAIDPGGGKVCFDTIDCVSFGAYSGSNAGTGQAFRRGGLVLASSAQRRLDLSGSSATLDFGDDTDDSETDFVAGLPTPRNNAGQAGTRACDLTASVTPNEQTEGDDVTLTVSACPGVSLDVATADGTASVGDDVVSSAESVTLSGPTLTRSFSILTDTFTEPPETFLVELRDVRGAFLATPDILVTIIDVPPPPPPIGRPGVPGSVAAAPGVRDITVTWLEPTSGDPADGYLIYAGPFNGPRSVVATLSTGQRSFTESGLGNNVGRSYQVSAFNVAGEGFKSLVVKATTFDVPGPPTDFVATPGPGVGEITVSWNAPVSDGRTPVTGFVVTMTSELCLGTGCSISTSPVQAGPDDRSTVFQGLVPGTRHEFDAVAVNAAGSGPKAGPVCQRPQPWLASLGCGPADIP